MSFKKKCLVYGVISFIVLVALGSLSSRSGGAVGGDYEDASSDQDTEYFGYGGDWSGGSNQD